MRASYRTLPLAVSWLLLSGSAAAHFTIIQPPPASTTKDGKGDPPCGPAMNSGVITPVQGGHEIDLVVDETVAHPGFYRVALALTALTELPADNVVYDKMNVVLPPAGPGTSDHADFEATPKFPVLADNLFPHMSGSPQKFSGKVTLPNVNCDKCTLQVIEFMASHGSNGPKAGFFYHNCANLKITADPALPTFDPNAGAGGSGSGGTGGSAGAATGGIAGSIGGTAGATTGGIGPSVGGSPSSSAGTPSNSGGMPASGGTPSSAGTATSSGGGGGGSGGSGTTAPITNDAPSSDNGGCGIATGKRSGLPALAALGLALGLVRRRRRAS